ncbi:hypothetical protein LZG00_00085 [Rhodobacteraceae bacterium LMO-12]|nr:hypothetical protein [Rhodobacteraceae bacterium LMO-JJ12]
MKLGYFFIPPENQRSGRFGDLDRGRGNMSRALGFSEFYLPAETSRSCGSNLRGPEGKAMLQVRSTTAWASVARLACTGGVDHCIAKPDESVLVSPQISDMQADVDIRAGRAPFSVSWADTETLSRQWSAHVIGCTRAGRSAHPRNWRVARSVLITDDGVVAKDMVMSADSPCRAYFRSVMGADASEASIDEKIDACVLYGNQDAVAEKLLKMTRATAAFGTLALADHAWADAERAIRSMRLLHDVVETCFSYPDRQMVSGWQ